MKIAIVTAHYGPPWNEGVRNLARRLVEFLQSKGDEVVIISPRRMDSGGLLGDRLLKVPLLNSLVFNIRAARQVRRVNADAVLVLASLSSALGIRSWLITRATRTPVIFYITGLRRLTFGYRFLFNARKVIVNSDFLRRFFPDAEVISPFIDTSRFTPVTRNTHRRSSNTILFLGAFQRSRGVEYLIRAIPHLNGRVEARLVIAWNGKGSNRYRRILRTIRETGIEERVAILQSADAPALYAQAAVVVIPRISRDKMTFPLRILEAVAMGVPLIVTRVNQMERLVDGCGLAVEPKDERALAGAIERLLTDKDLYLRLVDGCRGKAEEFKSERQLEKLDEELRTCR